MRKGQLDRKNDQVDSTPKVANSTHTSFWYAEVNLSHSVPETLALEELARPVNDTVTLLLLRNPFAIAYDLVELQPDWPTLDKYIVVFVNPLPVTWPMVAASLPLLNVIFSQINPEVAMQPVKLLCGRV